VNEQAEQHVLLDQLAALRRVVVLFFLSYGSLQL
jgi:hypothetical protein